MDQGQIKVRSVEGHGRSQYEDKVMQVQLDSLLDNLPEATEYFLVRASNRAQKEFVESDWAGKLRFVVQGTMWCLRRIIYTMKEKVSSVGLRVVSVLKQCRQLSCIRSDEKVTIAVNCTGGLGDLLVYAGFLRNLYEEWHYPSIHVFYPSLEAVRFVFQKARFVERVLHGASFESVKKSYDIVIRLNQFVACEVQNHDKILRINPDILNSIAEASQRTEAFKPYVAMHPYLDGLFAKRVSNGARNSRLDVLGLFSGVQYRQDSELFLCPDIAGYSRFQNELGLHRKKYIVIHDGWDNNFHLNHRIKDAATKCWPQSHWEEFIARVKSQCPDVMVVQIGGGNSRILKGTDLCLVGRTSLDLSAWIVKHALLHIDSDSGIVHLARSVHAKSIVLFGPTNADYFGYKQNHNVSSSQCSNCWWVTADWMVHCPIGLKEPVCMSSISPADIAQRTIHSIQSIRQDRYDLLDHGLYHSDLVREDRRRLEDIFECCSLTSVPISQHANNPESGLYIHASKQWEYLYILRALSNYASGDKRSLRIADLGGGRGALSAYLAKMGHNVTVYDIDYLWGHGGDMLIEQRYMTWAKNNGYRAEFGSLFNVPAETESFDVIVSVSVLEHVPFKYFALKEAFRLLKPGGVFVMTFDFANDGVDVGDAKCRIEVFSQKLLRNVLDEFDVSMKGFTHDQVQESAERIQKDQVLGIPRGMTVGSIAIRKQVL